MVRITCAMQYPNGVPRFIQSGEKTLGEAGECVRGFPMNGLHCALDLVTGPAASIQVRMDQPARYEAFLIDFNQYVEHRAGQRLGNGVLIAIEPLRVDPGSVRCQPQAGHIRHDGQIRCEPDLLGVRIGADPVDQVEHVEVAIGLGQQCLTHGTQVHHPHDRDQIGKRFMECQELFDICPGGGTPICENRMA